jgi:predicted double-glycine peptidase
MTMTAGFTVVTIAQALGAAAVVAGGFALGRWIGRRKWWGLGVAASFVGVLCVSAAGRSAWVQMQTPLRALTLGRIEYLLFATVAAVLVMALAMRVETRRLRRLLVIFAAIFCLYFGVYTYASPLITPMLLPRDRAPSQDVVMQTSPYTCGPAAAATALKAMGILDATELELTQLARTATNMGTDADALCDAINRRYGGRGVTCTRAYTPTIDHLRGRLPAIVVLKLNALTDHYVAVLAVTDTYVRLGDPLRGVHDLTHEQFMQRWRKHTLLLHSSSSESVDQ